jgi:hypothetical protein
LGGVLSLRSYRIGGDVGQGKRGVGHDNRRRVLGAGDTLDVVCGGDQGNADSDQRDGRQSNIDLAPRQFGRADATVGSTADSTMGSTVRHAVLLR